MNGSLVAYTLNNFSEVLTTAVGSEGEPRGDTPTTLVKKNTSPNVSLSGNTLVKKIQVQMFVRIHHFFMIKCYTKETLLMSEIIDFLSKHYRPIITFNYFV